jgi:uncharacterized membrane protein/predicted DsbA family dithiol-disulfide isomerase
MTSRTSTAKTSSSPTPRRAFWAALLLSVAGLALSLFLARLHARAHAGEASFCAISDVVNCDRVATSPWSVVLGLPVAVWGALGYGLAGLLAATGLARRERAATWPAGLLFGVGALAVGASVALALVSEFAIGAVCLLCAGSWLVSLALLAAARRACRGPGVVGAVRADLATLRASPRIAVGLLVLGVAGTAVAAVAYPRYWERHPPASAGEARKVAAGGGADLPGGPRAGTVVVEYSDYECPFCGKAHEDTKAILARRPDVTVVRRQFPLDSSCNKALTRQVHPSACNLARVAICAGEQGKFHEMDDALFRNQKEHASILDLSKRVGLDVERLKACLVSPDTERKLQADIDAALRDNVKATPSYVVGGVVKAGDFPVELLPPPPGGAAGASGASGAR